MSETIRKPDALAFPPGTVFRDAVRLQEEFGPYFDGRRLHSVAMGAGWNFSRPDPTVGIRFPVAHETAPGASRFVWIVVEKASKQEGWLPTGVVVDDPDHINGRFLFGYERKPAEAAHAAGLTADSAAEVRRRYDEAMKDPNFVEVMRGSGILITAPSNVAIPEDYRPDELH